MDDHRWYRHQLAQALTEHCGIRVLEATNAIEALTLLIGGDDVMAVVSDLRLDDEHGVPCGLQGDELLELVRRRFPQLRRALISAYTTAELATDSGHVVLDKSWRLSVIVERICGILE